jgi:4-hydroxy-3-methylbut-2-enyl diphosphate reductase
MSPAPQLTDVTLAEPRGFCAGVDRAIEIVERALKRFGAPIYVRHEIVHNTYVVNDLKAKGAIFIEDVADVARVQPRGDKLAVVTQTTLSVDDAAAILAAVKRRFPHVREPKKQDICYATQNRQEAVHSMAADADLVLVLGSQNSSNSQRLKEIALEAGVPAQLIDGARDIDDRWFEGVETVVITAGASAPESVVAECVAYLQSRYAATVESRVLRKEDVHFPLPRELRTISA